MEPVIGNYAEMEGPAEACAFLEAAPHHFLLTHSYLPEGFPAALCGRVIKYGPNRRLDYLHVPNGTDLALIRALCQRTLDDQVPCAEPNLSQLLQDMVCFLVDKTDLREVAREIIQRTSDLFDAEGAAILVYEERRECLRFVAVFSRIHAVEDRLRNLEVPIDQGVAGWVARHKQPQLVCRVEGDPRFNSTVDAKTDFLTRDLMASPILIGDKLIGVLEVVNRRGKPFSEYDLPPLRLLSSLVAIFLEKAQLLAERRKCLQSADKAEIANSLLHNIGNVLNGLSVAATTLRTGLEPSVAAKLERTADLIEALVADTATAHPDPRAAKIAPFVREVAAQLAEERAHWTRELLRMSDKIHLMKDIIETQQTIARMGSSDNQDLIQLIEEAIQVLRELLEQEGVQLQRDFHSDRPVRGEKSKLVHILINLIKNGIESMGHLPKAARLLRIETCESREGGVSVKIADQGHGVAPEHLSQIFNHGFTTKEDGHGFGLNFCAKAMNEMQGSLEVHSEGIDRGAVFVLHFPDFRKSELIES